MFCSAPRLATTVATALLSASALLSAGCGDQNDKGPPPPAATGCVKDTDCKGDRVCDHGQCSEDHPRTDHPQTGGGTSTPTQTVAAPPAKPAAPATMAYGELASIPTTESAPPTAEEWAAAPLLQGTDDVPKPAAEGCTVQLVREWLRLRCEGDLKSVSPDGNKWYSEKPGKNWFENKKYPDWAELVFRVKEGTLGEAYFRRVDAENSARFYMDWPRGKPKPRTLFLKKWKL